MNKSELIDAISTEASVSKKVAEEVLNATITSIMDAVVFGDKVLIVGFGSFEAKDRIAREGRNPKTGEIIQIPACKKPVFVAGKSFKERVDV